MQFDNLKQPIDMQATDQPNTCPFDGVRTSLLEVRDDYTVEQCQCCNRVFNFWNDEE